MKPKPQSPSSSLEAMVAARTRALQHEHEQMQRLHRRLQTNSACNRILMRAVDEPALLNNICRLVCDQAGYRLAWVGYAVHDAARTVQVAAQAGDTDGSLAAARLTWDDSEQGRSLTGRAIRTGVTCAIGDFSTDRSAAPWSRQALARGFRSGLALPLKDAGARVFGALTIYSTEPDAFTPEETRFLEELAGDLAFGLTVLRDRHEHRRAEEELRRSERGLAEAQRLVHLGNWELDLVRNELTWSDEIYRIFEIDPAKFAASYEAFLDAIHPEDRDRVNRAYTDSLKHKGPYEIVHRLLMPDGRIKHVSERCETFYDESGRPVRSVGTVHDITERKLAEAALHESEERYRTLIQNLQTAVVVHAEDTRILACNLIAQSLLGLTEDQLLGKTAVDPAWHFFREDGTPMPPEEYPVARVRATRQPVRNLVLGVYRPGDAQDVWAMVNANPVFGPGGQITEIIVTFIDISERKQAQERLDHLAAIVESTDDAIIGKTLDERILSWNRGAERIYGYTAGEIVGCPISILVPPGLKEELAAIMDGVKRGEAVEHLETTRVRKDGQTIQVALTISPIHDARGRIVGASTIARDITKRKRAELALHESQALYHSLVEQLSIGFFRKDAAGRYVYVNPWFCRLKRLKAEAFLNRTPADVKEIELTLNGPNAIQVEQLAEQAVDHHRQIMATGRPIVVEEMGFGPGGEKQFFSVLKTPVFDSAGKIIGSQGILFDITDLKRIEEEVRRLNAELEQRVADRTRELAVSEERMRQFFERQLMGSAITSPEKGWLQVNDKLCQMLGYSREELRHLTWAELTHPADLAADLAQFERLQRGEIESYMLEKRFVRKDGRLVHTNLAVGCVRRPDRSLDYVVALHEDITARKQAEADIQKLNRELRQRAASLEVSNRELEAFSYSVSHDLRAPLRSIDGFSRILLEDYQAKLDADGQDSLRRIRSASQRMGQLIDDLLALARVSRDEMHHGPVDLSALAGAVADGLRQAFPAQRIEFAIAPGLIAVGDSRLLQLVLENLLGNAVKFSSKQPVSRVEFGRAEHNGAGFDAATVPRHFGAFQRYHAATDFPGTGIGLATVQRIIQRHGGRLEAESRPGHGATFFFSLPDQSHATL